MRDRRPGDFARQLVGTQTSHAEHGWRRFMLTDPGVVVEDNNAYVASVDESSGNTAVTTSSIVPDSEYPINYAFWQIPLTNALGEPVTFVNPFTLKTMVEFIDMTGGFNSGSNYHKPAFGFGLGQNATDIEGLISANKYLAAGQVASNQTGSGIPQFRRLFGKSTASGNIRNRSGTLTAPAPQACSLCITDWSYGPAIGSTPSVVGNTCKVLTRFYNVESEGYAKNTNVSIHQETLNQPGSVPQVDTQAQLFAWFGDYDSTNGTQDQAVTTVRMWYMVHSEPGPTRVDAWKVTGLV